MCSAQPSPAFADTSAHGGSRHCRRLQDYHPRSLRGQHLWDMCLPVMPPDDAQGILSGFVLGAP